MSREDAGAGELLIDEDFRCRLCAELFLDPFLTRCGHAFCYRCIWKHLEFSHRCPLCEEEISRETIYPDFVLGKLLHGLARTPGALGGGLSEKLRNTILSRDGISMKEIDDLMKMMEEKKEELMANNREDALHLLLEFLEYSKRRREERLLSVQENLHRVERDLGMEGKDRSRECSASGLDELEKLAQAPTLASGTEGALGNVTRSLETSMSMLSQDWNLLPDPHAKDRLLVHFEDLKMSYLDKVTQGSWVGTEREGAVVESDGVEQFERILSRFLQFSKLQLQAEIQPNSTSNPSNIISSIEVNATNTAFATAGVSKQVSVYNFATIVEGVEENRPCRQMNAGSKLSCLTWNHCDVQLLASSAYAGVVSVWDVEAGKSIVDFEEHQKRVWSVDFCEPDPKLLVSGGDDGRIKVWSTMQKHSIHCIDIKANVCCVRCSPVSSHCIAAGSADHQIHLYDIRAPRTPLLVIKGHKKAVSYVRFVGGEDLVSASIDSSLKLWDTREGKLIRSFMGHANDRNFVGLAVNQDFISCGSETNDVYVYYKELSKPLCSFSFHDDSIAAASETETSQFVSSVCWRSDCMTLLGANSMGVVKVLTLT